MRLKPAVSLFLVCALTSPSSALTPALTAARLCLLRGVQTVIRNGLEVLGVSAPERM